VELKREQIRELIRHAKTSSRKALSSQDDEPFNLRNHKPIHSNKFGRLYEITPEKNPQLRDLDVFLSSVDIREVIQRKIIWTNIAIEFYSLSS